MTKGEKEKMKRFEISGYQNRKKSAIESERAKLGAFPPGYLEKYRRKAVISGDEQRRPTVPRGGGKAMRRMREDHLCGAISSASMTAI